MELDSGSDDGLVAGLDRLLPRDERWRYRHGSAEPRRRLSPHAAAPNLGAIHGIWAG